MLRPYTMSQWHFLTITICVIRDKKHGDLFMNKPRETILKLLSEGKITIEEAEELLDAISGGGQARHVGETAREHIRHVEDLLGAKIPHRPETANKNSGSINSGFNFDFHFPWDDPDWKWPWDQEGWQWPWEGMFSDSQSQDEPLESTFLVEENSSLVIKSGDGNISIRRGDSEEFVVINSTEDETQCEFSDDHKAVYVSADDANLSIQIPPRIVSIQISKDDGNVAIRDITSDIALKLADGSIAISGVNGKIHVALDDGNIVLNDVVSDEIALKMGDGSIALNMTQPVTEGSFNVKLDDGRISLALPSDSKCQITATVEDGMIQHNLQSLSADILDEHEGYLNAILNGGGANFSLALEDGSIAIRS
jgi:hypothetical protein